MTSAMTHGEKVANAVRRYMTALHHDWHSDTSQARAEKQQAIVQAHVEFVASIDAALTATRVSKP
jgi:hypothetical protein